MHPSTAFPGHRGSRPDLETRAAATRDLESREDLELLLRDLYRRAFADRLLRRVFVDVVHMDLERHLPVITDFWQKVLFGTGAYDGQAVQVHRRVHALVPLTADHFDRWLALWRKSIEAAFCGPVADLAYARAERMAAVCLHNLTGGGPRRSLPVVAASAGRARPTPSRPGSSGPPAPRPGSRTPC